MNVSEKEGYFFTQIPEAYVYHFEIVHLMAVPISSKYLRVMHYTDCRLVRYFIALNKEAICILIGSCNVIFLARHYTLGRHLFLRTKQHFLIL